VFFALIVAAAWFVRLGFERPQRHAFQPALAVNAGDLHSFVHHNIRRCMNASDQVIGHVFAQTPANQQMDGSSSATFREKHRRLACRVSRSDYSHVLIVVERSFDAGTRVMNSGRLKAFRAFNLELAPAHPRCRQNRAGAQLGVVSRHLPGPTTVNPTAPVSSNMRRRSWAAVSRISPTCGSLVNTSRSLTPEMRMRSVRPRATPVTIGGRRVSRSISPENCRGPCVTTLRFPCAGFKISIAPDSTTNKSIVSSPALKIVWPSS
jgi:hypothetical protein